MLASRMQGADQMMQALGVGAGGAGGGGGLNGANGTPANIGGQPWDTRPINDHPLYPLLKVVFQKCELATCSPRDSNSDAVFSSDSFTEDIRAFVDDYRRRRLPVSTNQPDLDQFMLNAIEVLRFHLLELEKVHTLCDSFCTRYITTLKGKMPVDYVHEDTNNNSNSNNNPGGGNNGANGGTGAGNGDHQKSNNGGAPPATGTPASSTGSAAGSTSSSSNGHGGGGDAASALTLNASTGPGDYPVSASAGSSAAAAAYNYYEAAAAAAAAAGHHAHHAPHHQQHMQHHTMYAGQHQQQHHNSNDNSIKTERGNENGANSAANSSGAHLQPSGGANAGERSHDDARSPTGSTGSFLGDASLGSGDGTEGDDDDQRQRRQQKKRGIFPKAATNAMRNWLFHHLNHPYPSEDQKKSLAESTGLTILQVNNWFINARRRIVQPMIDQSNRTGGSIMGGSAYSPDASMGAYMMDRGQPYGQLAGVDAAASAAAAAAGMQIASMNQAMHPSAVYQAAQNAQHLSAQYNRQQHAAMLGLPPGATGGPHMLGLAPPPPPPHPPHNADYY